MKRASSIRRKVTFALFGAFGLALGMAALALGVFEYRAADTRARTTLESLAETLVFSLSAALDFDAPEVAEQNLARLEPGGIVLGATIFRLDRDQPPRLFARYLRAGATLRFPPVPQPAGFRRSGDRALLVYQVRTDNRPVALLVVEADITVFRRGLRELLFLLGVVLIALALGSLALSRLLQRALTRPLVQLAETAAQVHLTGDITLRAPVTTRDEIGQLATTFNEMLTGIALRDRQLAEQAAFQQAVLENAGVSIISTDGEGTIRTFNDAAERMLGYTRAEMIGRASPVACHDAAELQRHAAALTRRLGREVRPGFGVFVELCRQGPSVLEWTYVRKDGSRLPVFLVVSMLRTPDGRALGLCGIATDLTERKATEDALRDSEERLRQSLEASPVGLSLVDQSGRMLYFNRKFVEWFGYTTADLPHLDAWWPRAYPDRAHREQIRRLWDERMTEAVARGGEMRPMEAEVTCRDGRQRLIEFRSQQFSGMALVAFTDITERQQAEEALRAREAQMNHLLAAADCLLWQARVTRRESGEFDWRLYIPRSGLYRRLFGVDPGSPPVLMWEELGVPELNAMHACCRAALTSGAPGYAQEFQATVAGQTVWLHEEVMMTQTPDAAWSLVGVITDITARKGAENAVRASEERYRALAENNLLGLLVLQDGVIRYVNPRLTQLTGYETSADLIGRDGASMIAPEFRDEVMARMARIIRGEILAPHTGYQVIRRDGSPLWVSSGAAPTTWDGRPALLGFIVDITDRKQAEDAVRASEERFRIVAEQTGQIIFDYDFVTEAAVWAGAVFSIIGYTPAELAAIPPGWWLERIHPDDREAYVASHKAMSEGISPLLATFRFRHAAGRWIHLQANATLIHGGTGAPHRMLGTLANVTQQQEAAEAIRRLNAELEQRVRDRTAELDRRVAEVERLNAELRTSQQTTDRTAARLQEVNSNLIAANQELEAFSYSVSHDLRAPLRNISGFIELLRRRSGDRLDAEAGRFFTIVSGETVRMGALIDDLLTFSRLGRAELKLEPVALAGLIAAVQQQELASDLAGRDIEWRIQPMPPVRADRVLLRQVVVNLLSNAVKFTRQRHPALIEFGVEPAPPGAKTAVFFCRDNGAGFNPKYLDKMFRVFQRLHNAREFEGTGIGLANVKRIVTRHGGRVWAEGAVGQGAAFFFVLPTHCP